MGSLYYTVGVVGIFLSMSRLNDAWCLCRCGAFSRTPLRPILINYNTILYVECQVFFVVGICLNREFSRMIRITRILVSCISNVFRSAEFTHFVFQYIIVRTGMRNKILISTRHTKCYIFITFLNQHFCTGFRLRVQWERGFLGCSSVAILCWGKK